MRLSSRGYGSRDNASLRSKSGGSDKMARSGRDGAQGDNSDKRISGLAATPYPPGSTCTGKGPLSHAPRGGNVVENQTQ